jgi:hypothetical protein
MLLGGLQEESGQKSCFWAWPQVQPVTLKTAGLFGRCGVWGAGGWYRGIDDGWGRARRLSCPDLFVSGTNISQEQAGVGSLGQGGHVQRSRLVLHSYYLAHTVVVLLRIPRTSTLRYLEVLVLAAFVRVPSRKRLGPGTRSLVS